MPLSAIFAIVAGCGMLLPSPLDRNGLGLRVHGLSKQRPFFVKELIHEARVSVLILNFSKCILAIDPLSISWRTGDLKLKIVDPEGNNLATFGHRRFLPRDPFAVQLDLKPGTGSSEAFRLIEFGYFMVGKPGRYRIECSLNVGKVKLTAPPLDFEVVGLPPESILASVVVPYEGPVDGRPEREHFIPRVEQVLVGKKILLLYQGRQLAELPGKVEMKVEGAYGAGNPVTIIYKTAPTAKPVRLVINSVSGSPWTAEEEQQRLERIAPAPRVVKP